MSEDAPQTVPLTAGTAASEARPLRLCVIDGPDRGLEQVISRGTATIGSQPGCELKLSDATVSRAHAQIELLGPRLRLKDLGSRNGTRFHGARVDTIEVPYGAIVSLGKSVIALLPLAAPAGELSERTELGPLLGRSVAMRRLFALIERVAPTEAAIFIKGETGTGKEGVGRAIHLHSQRAHGPFQVLDCGATAKALAASALFGHVRGAFTSAHADAPGALEAAHGGTLFVDEVAELPLDVQPLLLRALETQTFQRVGDTRERAVSFRLVSATHRDLQAMVRKGQFREDLYHRLVVVALDVPPLRDRAEDVPLLARHFAAEKGDVLDFRPEIIASLCAYAWPGNVRELQNLVERARTLGVDAAVPQPSTSGLTEQPPNYQAAKERVLRGFTRAYLEAQLARYRGSVAKAAKEAGLARTYYYKLLEEHGIAAGRK